MSSVDTSAGFDATALQALIARMGSGGETVSKQGSTSERLQGMSTFDNLQGKTTGETLAGLDAPGAKGYEPPVFGGPPIGVPQPPAGNGDFTFDPDQLPTAGELRGATIDRSIERQEAREEAQRIENENQRIEELEGIPASGWNWWPF